MRTQKETDLQEENERLQARVEALKGVRDAAVDYLEGDHVSGISLYKAKAALIMAIKLAATEQGESDE